MSIFCATSSTSHDALLRQGFGGHPASRSGTVQILRSALAQSRMVGEEVLRLPREINALPKGAGEKNALKANGYFEPSPHRVRGACHGPPDPEKRSPADGWNHGRANSQRQLEPHQRTEAASAFQAPSALSLQIFCLSRRCALSAPMAASLAPLIWGICR